MNPLEPLNRVLSNGLTRLPNVDEIVSVLNQAIAHITALEAEVEKLKHKADLGHYHKIDDPFTTDEDQPYGEPSNE